MKIQFRNRTQMMQATLSFLLNSPPAVLLLIPVLSTFSTVLETIVNAILAADQTQLTVAQGAGPARDAKKNTLLNMALSIGRAVMSFSANSGNVALENLMKTMLTEMEEKADAEFIQRCTAIINSASDNAASLAPFGVTGAVITAFTNLLDNYQTSESTVSVRNKIVERADATKTIPMLLKQATALLEKQIDPLVYSLPDIQNSYKQRYRDERKVIDLGHRYTTFKGLTKVKDTAVVLSNVEIEFLNSKGETFTIKSDSTGAYRERLTPEVYRISATHPDMQPFIIDGIAIQPGEMKIENFEMIPRS